MTRRSTSRDDDELPQFVLYDVAELALGARHSSCVLVLDQEIEGGLIATAKLRESLLPAEPPRDRVRDRPYGGEAARAELPIENVR